MFATRWILPLSLAGCLTIGSVAANGADTDAVHRASFRDTPFGRMVSGNIGRLMVLRSEAKVTPEQRQQVRAILVSHKAEIGPVLTDLVEKRRALRDAVRNDQADETAIRQAADALGDSIGDAAVLAAKLRGELQPVFNEEQVELFHKFLQEHDASVDTWLREAFAAQQP